MSMPKSFVDSMIKPVPWEEALQEMFAEFDVIGAARRMRCNRKLYLTIMQQFINTHEVPCDIVRQAVQQQDFEALRKYAHLLKSVSGSIGATVLYRVSTNLELQLDLVERAFDIELEGAKLSETLENTVAIAKNIVTLLVSLE